VPRGGEAHYIRLLRGTGDQDLAVALQEEGPRLVRVDRSDTTIPPDPNERVNDPFCWSETRPTSAPEGVDTPDRARIVPPEVYGCGHAERLVGRQRVVDGDVAIQGELHLRDGGEASRHEQLVAKGPVESLHLAGRGGRADRGEQVADPVLAADAIEQDLPARAAVPPVNTRPLSVNNAWGTPWARSACAKASQTGRAVAWGMARASTQNREWSSRPVKIFTDEPFAGAPP
jgi:hypothetical protein